MYNLTVSQNLSTVFIQTSFCSWVRLHSCLIDDPIIKLLYYFIGAMNREKKMYKQLDETHLNSMRSIQQVL